MASTKISTLPRHSESLWLDQQPPDLHAALSAETVAVLDFESTGRLVCDGDRATEITIDEATRSTGR